MEHKAKMGKLKIMSIKSYLLKILNNIKDTPIFYSIIKLNIDTKISK